MNQQPPPIPPSLTKDQIAILVRHASERAELEAEQYNARVAMQERHRAESVAAVAVEVPLVPRSSP